MVAPLSRNAGMVYDIPCSGSGKRWRSCRAGLRQRGSLRLSERAEICVDLLTGHGGLFNARRVTVKREPFHPIDWSSRGLSPATALRSSTQSDGRT